MKHFEIHEIESLIEENLDKWEQAKKKPAIIGWFVGRVMKNTDGLADPDKVIEYLKLRLEE